MARRRGLGLRPSVGVPVRTENMDSGLLIEVEYITIIPIMIYTYHIISHCRPESPKGA